MIVCYFNVAMAKTNKSLKLVQKKPKTTDCYVRLKRLSPETIKQYLANRNNTHNISVKIKNHVMDIGTTKIKSTDNTFNIQIKINSEEVLIYAPKIEMPASNRVLRPKTTTVSTSPSRNLKTSRKSCLIVAKPTSKSIAKLVDEAWRQCKHENAHYKQNIHLNDIVMAKLRGHPAWPAIIVEINNKARIKVRFFGAQQTEMFGFVNIGELTPFSNSINVIRLTLMRNIPQFQKGVREVERVYGIPISDSIAD